VRENLNSVRRRPGQTWPALCFSRWALLREAFAGLGRGQGLAGVAFDLVQGADDIAQLEVNEDGENNPENSPDQRGGDDNEGNHQGEEMASDGRNLEEDGPSPVVENQRGRWAAEWEEG